MENTETLTLLIDQDYTMQTNQNPPEIDLHHHTAKIKAMLTDIIDHVREDVNKVDEPKAQALFETTAEVLNGLVTAYSHYEEHSESAWR